jgi:hypothetical protein
VQYESWNGKRRMKAKGPGARERRSAAKSNSLSYQEFKKI